MVLGEDAVAAALPGDSLPLMSTKQLTLSWLAELPDESPVWRQLHDDARLLRDIAAAIPDPDFALTLALGDQRC